MIRIVLLLLLLVLMSSISLAASGPNLIVNGNAETGDTTGWDASGGMEVTLATGSHAGFGAFTFTGGSYLGGSQPVLQGMTQTIDLTEYGTTIDEGNISYKFSVQLQSRFTNIANAILDFDRSNGSRINTLYFFDNSELNIFNWERITSSGIIPADTRTIIVTLLGNKSVGDLAPPLDAFFDEAHLSIQNNSPMEPTKIPFPSIALLALATLLVLAVSSRHRADVGSF